MCVDIVRIPWVKSLSLIRSDLLQRIFVCCPCLWLACLHSPCWFTCCWHISSKWHPNWCLQVAGPSVTRLSTPHAYTHAHTCAHIYPPHIFSQTVMGQFYLHSPFGSGWLCELAGVCWCTLSDKSSVCKGICDAFPLWYPRHPWLSIPSVANLANYSR